MNGFELYKQGQLQAAIAAYTDELNTKPSPTTLANRSLAFISIGQYEAAIRDARAADELQALETGDRGDGYAKQRAVALWLSGERLEARSVLAAVVSDLNLRRFQFTDRAGGIGSALLLWYTAIGTAGEDGRTHALRFMQSKVDTGLTRNWPGPIADHILGRISYMALMSSAQQQASLALRRGCLATFYAGILARAIGDDDRASQMLTMAVEYGQEMPIELEYFLARNEIARSRDEENSSR